MKKILVSMFLLVFGLCLVGCDTLVEYAYLSSITKDEDFTSAYIASVNGDAQVLPVDFNGLKEKDFYKNIMNSSAKHTDVLPEQIPTYSLVIKSDDNILHIDCMSDLYAQYNDEWYIIKCSKEDSSALEKYLFPNEEDEPTNHFLRNQLGCEWLNEIDVDNIVEINIISESVGVAPGAFKDITSSTDKTVISRIFEDCYWLDTTPISKEEGKVDGGGAVTMKFILNDGSVKELYINNGNYRDTNGDYYELLYIPKFNEQDEYESSYGFITYQDMFEVYTPDGVKLRDFDGLSEFGFIEYPYDEIEENEDFGYLETEFGRLYIHSYDVFYIKEGNVHKFYLIIGEKNFYDLFNVDD